HLIQSAVTKLIQLFPFGPDCAAQRARYNAMARDEIEQVRDFVILHYHVTEREDTEFWRYLKHMEVPDTLQARIDSFVEGAQAWQAAGEVFRVDSWVQCLLGQRLTPKSWHRMGQVMSDGRLEQTLAGVAKEVAGRVEAMPRHQQFLDGYCPQ
ncbi:MAG: tryptophan 7-halogenase, partial [Sphingopyxis sp.]|nr:tryptophan 7-halogenase [Sphingopyxis sp.]